MPKPALAPPSAEAIRERFISIWSLQKDGGQGAALQKVGVLLFNIYTSSWKKDKDNRFKEMTDFQEFPEVQDIASLKSKHARWESMLLEVMYGEFATDETVVESVREVFCKFQPMLAHAADAGKKAGRDSHPYLPGGSQIKGHE